MKKNVQRLLTISILTSMTGAGIFAINKLINASAVIRNALHNKSQYFYDWKFGRIHYTIEGSGSPLLLLHDLSPASSSVEWKFLKKQLAKDHTVYCMDLLGCGCSDRPKITYTNFLYVQLITEEGLRGNYGANIGKVLLATYGDQDVKVRAKAMAAAGSDARMNGCELPVVINSGSGNQGITASVPIVVFAKELQVSEETMYRALVISNLATIHIKEGIGRLSAYCGAVGAGCGCGAGIAYLYGDGKKEGEHAIVNGLAIVSGMICDGAKASCAAKIASSVDAGILGYFMYKNGQQFIGGDGIVKKGVENTIRCVGKLASEGMLETDREIVHLMIHG